MAAAYPRFWSQPLRYMRWASHEKPALFWSLVLGSLGPVSMVVIPPIRKRLGAVPVEPIPMTYPIPSGPRIIPQGYDDQ